MIAPGRGRWERHLSREERSALQRRRILDVIARVIAERGNAFTVDDIVEAAGIGRNTFYAHFADAETATAALLGEMTAAVRAALEVAVTGARTPLEQVRGLALAWSSCAAEHPALALLAQAELEEGGINATLRDYLGEVLTRARRSGAVGRAPDPLRIELLVGAFDAGAEHVATEPETEQTVAEALADLMVRALR